MHYLVFDHLFPEFNIWQKNFTFYLEDLLGYDSLSKTKRLEIQVDHPKEVREMFRKVSYMKGASIIRMLYNYIGSSDFQAGMNLYLNRWAYKNVVSEDLSDALEETSKKPIKAILNTWTSQKGFPLVNVSVRQDGSNRVLTFSQERFSIEESLTEEEQRSKWILPLSIITQNGSKVLNVLIENRTQEIILNNVVSNEWIQLDPNMTSYCFINIDNTSLNTSIADRKGNSIRLYLQFEFQIHILKYLLEDNDTLFSHHAFDEKRNKFEIQVII
jgi:puromycin-sensitive aminopeptidase